MTDEEINSAIAEYLGTARVDTFPPLTDARLEPKAGRLVTRDYVTDLNAMHEAESVIGTSPKWTRSYIGTLRVKGAMDGIHATARQRAEAFVFTIGKLKE